jgi:competence protein ComEC
MFNPSAYPFFRLCFALAIGIFVQDQLVPSFDPTLYFYIAVVACALASLYIHRNVATVWVSGLVVLLSLMVFGMQLTHQAHEVSGNANHFTKLPASQVYAGIVQDLPEPTKNGYKFRLRVQQTIYPDQTPITASGNLQIYVKTDSLGSFPQYGDLLLVKCTPAQIGKPLNPDAFDFAQYMHTQNVHYQAFTKQDSVVVVANDRGNIFWKYTYASRAKVLGVLAKHFKDPAELGVAEALLVGYKGHLPDELQNAYIETGSMHILAVSGAHVGIIFLGMVMVLRRIHIRHRYWRLIETCLILFSIWAFAFLAGMGPSIARATVMFTFFLIARAFRLDYEGYNIIAASAFCLLLYEPLMLFQVSFQLSYLAVLGMMLFYGPLYKRSPLMPKWLDYFWQIFLLGIAAQLGTLPLSLLYFNQFPTYFWLSGLIVVPIASLYMYAAAVLILVEWIVPALSTLVATPILWMVKAMNYTIYALQNLPGALLDGIWFRWWDVVIMGCMVAVFALYMQRPKGKLLLQLAAGTFLLSASHFIKTFIQRDQIEVVIYHTGSSRALYCDLVRGHSRATYADTLVTETTARFAARAHRMSLGVHAKDQCTQAQTVCTNGKVVAQQAGPLVQFGNQTFAILDQPYQFKPTGQTIEVETLVINTDQEIEQVLQVFRPKTLVIGQSVRRRAAEKWAIIAQNQSIAVHTVASLGAWRQVSNI